MSRASVREPAELQGRSSSPACRVRSVRQYCSKGGERAAFFPRVFPPPVSIVCTRAILSLSLFYIGAVKGGGEMPSRREMR